MLRQTIKKYTTITKMVSRWEKSYAKNFRPAVILHTTSISYRKFSGTSYNEYGDAISVADQTAFYDGLDMTEQIRNILIAKKMKYIEKDAYFHLKDCPKCPPIKNVRSNMYKLTVWKNIGGYFCNRCSTKGNFHGLSELLNYRNKGTLASSFKMQDLQRVNDQRKVSLDNKENTERMVSESTKNLDENLDGGLDWIIEKRGLTKETCQAFSIGLRKWFFSPNEKDKVIETCVVFPLYSLENSSHLCQRVKVRSIKEKAMQCMYPRGGDWGMVGMNLVTDEDEEVVITEGEFDAMAVYQTTGMKAVSLPIGANFFPIQFLDMLKNMKRIYLWFDNDIKGQEAVEKFSRKIGIERCYFVTTDQLSEGKSIKDANEALLKGLDLAEIIKRSRLVPHKQIALFSELESEIWREVKTPDEKRGTLVYSLPELNDLLLGHRNGELTIYTGQTGIGKTTLLSQISLDLAKSGVSTLWGSFEIKAARLGKVMMGQLSGLSEVGMTANFDMIMRQMEQIPLRFLRFFGSSDLNEVLEAMEYSSSVHDVKHFVLDNLQFMMGHSHRANKFDQIDWAISQLRQFATNRNVHVSVVMHPRKENDETDLGISSIFGSAKASQEADNIIILNRYKEGSKIRIKKNRFSGRNGSFDVTFDPQSRLFFSEQTPLKFGRPHGLLHAREKYESLSASEDKGLASESTRAKAPLAV